MSATPSTMLPLGSTAPDFRLHDPGTGTEVGLADVRTERGVIVMFLSNHCPFVKHVKEELVRIGREYRAKGLGVVAIMSNDVANHPDDAPERMVEQGYPFPYLYDEVRRAGRVVGLRHPLALVV
ncbi:MAG TPA: redoxin family protein, partial [Myxococcota bacterium]|nr:redoxin family protein [Myxococcota bacterium]